MSRDEEIGILTGLLDFYSDRATTHASFVVAGTFGFYTILFANEHFDQCIQSRVVFLLACLALITINVYSFLNFGYYATLADITKVRLEGQHFEEYEDKLKEKLHARKNPFVNTFMRLRESTGRKKFGLFFLVFVFAVLLPFVWICLRVFL